MLQTIQVSEYESLLPSLVEVYRLEADDFQAGQLPYFVNEWRALTSDTEILETVPGNTLNSMKLRFKLTPRFNHAGEKKKLVLSILKSQTF